MDKTKQELEVDSVIKYASFYKSGAMSKELAQYLAQPYLDKLNKKQKEIAKKFNKSHKKIIFNDFTR